MRRWRAWLGIRLQARLAWPADALFAVLGDLVVAAVGVAVVLALYAHVSAIRGWSAGEVLMAWGLAQASLGGTRALFGGLWVLNRRYVLGGELDRVLLRPADPFAQVMVDEADPGPLWLALAGLGVFGWGAGQAGIPLGPAQAAAVLAFVAGGVLLVAGVLTATASVGFWMRHEGSAVGLAAQLTAFAHVPLDALPRGWALLVTTALPFAFTGAIPAAWLTGHQPWARLGEVQPLVGIAAFAVGQGLFRAGLRRYGSAGH
jgi:viologen exporter family transport system permease protein